MGKMVRNFVSGVGSLFDWQGNLNISKRSDNPSQADADALRSDWEQVGADIRGAMAAVDRYGK